MARFEIHFARCGQVVAYAEAVTGAGGRVVDHWAIPDEWDSCAVIVETDESLRFKRRLRVTAVRHLVVGLRRVG